MDLSFLDFSIFTQPSAWVTMLTLIFLEIVLGVDNLVFIAITTNRLPEEKQHLGRKLGLAGALVMRIIFLCFASLIMQLTDPLFMLTLGSFSHGFSIRDLVLLAGGAYLIYKGIAELKEVLKLTELKAEQGSEEHKKLHQLALPQAIAIIMVMDVVFSIDSVITAVGLAEGMLLIMIIAVMVAVFVMIIFVDAISDFINNHPEMKILALVFIVAIGVLLVLDAIGIHSGIEPFGLHIPVEKLLIYFAMVFSIILELIQMRFNRNYNAWRKERWNMEALNQVEAVRDEMRKQLEADKLKFEQAKGETKPNAGFTPVIVDSNVYIMMPVDNTDVHAFREILEHQSGGQKFLNEPIELSSDTLEVEDIEKSPEPRYELPED